MNFCGIICEYNPLHKGHIYHIKSTESILKPDGIICVMSGNFVQRGEPAVTNKYTRAKWAVKAGADIVIELPAVFALSPAENFAYGGVKILSEIKSVKYLSFGSECGNIGEIEKLINELDKAKITHNLKKGLSYASSFADSSSIGYKSNNILAVEYIRAIDKLKSKIIPFTMPRTDNGYNSSNLCGEFCSASAIRKSLYENNLNDLKDFMPGYVYEDLSVYKDVNKSLFDMLIYKILTTDNNELSKYAYISEGIENRIINAAKNSCDYYEFLENIKTKRYPESKIKRILMCLLLNITAKSVNTAKKSPPYARILALKQGREDILSEISKDIKIITRASDYNDTDDIALKIDILATQIYSKLICNKNINDYIVGLPKI